MTNFIRAWAKSGESGVISRVRERSRYGEDGFGIARSRVLVAEDDAEMRSLIGSALRGTGRYEVFEVKHGIDLLDVLATNILYPETPPAFDLVISDVRMPGVSGLEILNGLRAAGVWTPFIVLTGFGSAELHEEARHLGAEAVLDKPFDMDELLEAAAGALGLPTASSATEFVRRA